MTVPSSDIAPGDRGRVSVDLQRALAETVAAWDELLESVEGIDLAAASRKEGRTSARTLVVLGSWTEGRPLARIRADALAGIRTAEPLDDIEARMIDAHLGDGREAILGSVRRAREDVAEWSTSPGVEREALLQVGGPLGVVPLGTLVCATAFQCAVASLDLAPAGVVTSDTLARSGLLSLIDTVGAVAAQQPVEMSLAALTPQVGVRTQARGGSWTTTVAEDPGGPALLGDARLLLDVAAGRVSAPAAYARGDLRARDISGLLTVARVLAAAPGLPGTDGLRTALAAYATTAQAARAVADSLGGALRRWRRG